MQNFIKQIEILFETIREKLNGHEESNYLELIFIFLKQFSYFGIDLNQNFTDYFEINDFKSIQVNKKFLRKQILKGVVQHPKSYFGRKFFHQEHCITIQTLEVAYFRIS